MRELSAELLNEITRRLAESIHPERIYLFGSHATGRADDDSDVDLLVVVGDVDQSHHDVAIKGHRSLWGLEIPFDIVVCTKSQFNRFCQVKNTVMNEALCEGRVVYGA